jgi:hypothetical protein
MFLTLHLIEVKPPWGGIYEAKINHDVIKTADKVYWKAWHKYDNVRNNLESKIKAFINGRTFQAKTHILFVFSLSVFNK